MNIQGFSWAPRFHPGDIGGCHNLEVGHWRLVGVPKPLDQGCAPNATSTQLAHPGFGGGWVPKGRVLAQPLARAKSVRRQDSHQRAVRGRPCAGWSGSLAGGKAREGDLF